MPNDNYVRGANFERRIMADLTAVGYWCVRSAGSHGLVDVVALRQHFHVPVIITADTEETAEAVVTYTQAISALLIQCKSTQQLRTGRLDTYESSKALVQLAATTGAIPVLAEKRPLGISMIDLRDGKELSL